MDDFFMKFVVLIVAVVTMAGLVAFAIGAFREGYIIEDRFQEIEGDAGAVSFRLSELCDRCTKRTYENKDCFLLTATLNGIINENTISKAINPFLDENIHELRIKNTNGVCEVELLETR